MASSTETPQAPVSYYEPGKKTGLWTNDEFIERRLSDTVVPPTIAEYPRGPVIAVQPAQAQINISGTAWLIIGVVLFFLLKDK